ncbi:S8 family peptidase [Exiguobacterium sp. MH3]|uniref:S8 family peptidase n=1 Tax=Exiguobacterium sp. MH3 TaxID=1399115 RepID=UPI0003C3D0E5|nr:S8 family peptidase [Exiguobacterium sp. MH3]AHA30811.1 peptidase S8 [Exiguobacterium sp. MH3]
MKRILPLLLGVSLLTPSVVSAATTPLPMTSQTLRGTYDASGRAVFTIPSALYIERATHLEFDLDRSKGSVYTSKKNYSKGTTYKRYRQLQDEALIFPLSWSGTQYVVFEGKPGTRYQIPFSLRKLQPLLPMKPSATTSKTASLLVKMKHGSLKQSVSTSLQATRSSLPALSLEEWTFKSKAAAQQAKRYLERSAAVDYVEHTQTVRTAKDMYRPYQWSLQNTGQRKGKVGADIQYAAALKRLAGKTLQPTLVAVVDTGINSTYADFAGRVRTDLGYDFIRGKTSVTDPDGHGSHVAGIIAANADNLYGIQGINPAASLIPIRVLDAHGQGSTSDVARGILHAVKKGARVINLSLEMDEKSRAIEDAIAYADQKKVLVVAASGNDGAKTISYPARYAHVLSVGATDRKDIRASFSNRGKGLDLVAPGVEIPSYIGDGELAYSSGTSMAAPHVAAVASLLMSLKPSLSPSATEKLLKSSARDLGTKGYDTSYGYGRLDVNRAVSLVK